MSQNLKSILTTAMENAAAKTNADETEEQTVPTSNEVAAKRLLKRAGIAALATVAAVTAVILISNKLSAEDETEEDDETPEAIEA